MRATRALLVLALAGAACAACVDRTIAGPRGPTVTTSPGDVRVAKDRPPLAVIARDGDARGAIAAAVITAGVAPERGAAASVALGGAIEARLEQRGFKEATVAVGFGGYRVRALADEAAATPLVEALRAAMLAPMESDAAALAGATKKLAALAKKPLRDLAMLDAARCTGEPFAVAQGADAAAVSGAELEAWRRAAHGLGRVAFAVTGGAKLVEAATLAVSRGEPWPVATPIADDAWPKADARPEVYDATGSIAPGATRVTLVARTASAAQAVASTTSLGDPRGPLASRLLALDAPASLESVVATAHANGGCVAVTLDIAARDLANDASGRIATAVALARQELAVEIREAPVDAHLARTIALRAGDPRDAAERAAWWTLSTTASVGAPAEPRFAVAIGLASSRDAAAADALQSRATAIRSDVDRAMVAWHSPVVEAKTRVERGQGELWLVLASPCGTGSEVDGDAGLAAAVAVAAAKHAAASSGAADATIEPWATTDGIGVIVHGAALANESAALHARRLADLAARSFAADTLEPSAIAQARASLLGAAGDREGRVLTALGGALAPGHPSWVTPLGTSEGLGRSSDEAVRIRASALRGGPLRVAVIANADAAQSDAAVHAVDRWIARRPGEARTCASAAIATPAARPGTYAVEIASGATAEASLALPFAVGDEARASATWLAAMLDGPGGLLAHALGDGALAKSFGARVMGEPRAPALVVRVAAGNSQLDAAVAQVRALLDRVRQGSLTEVDRARATTAIAKDDLAASLDPRARLLALWRAPRGATDLRAAGAPPSLDALRAFAAQTLKDDALVIVAARPSRGGKP